MPAVPAPIRTWSSRMNVPFTVANTATNALQTQFAAWSLKQHLIDAHTSDGTLYGSRAPNSVWTVVGSSDGATAGMDGVDRWTTTFTASKLVRAATGSAHSWIVLQNSTSGIQVCIDLNGTNSGQCAITYTRSAFPFTGGSITTRPTAAANNEWMSGLQRGTTPNTSSSGGNIIAESTTNQVMYTHFSCAEDGTFHFEVSRAGSGYCSVFIALWRTSGANPSDTRNWYAIHDTSDTTRGAPRHNTNGNGITGSTSGTTARNTTGAICNTGGIRLVSFGNTPYPGANGNVDALTGNYYAEPLEVREISPQMIDRGYFADIVFIGNVTIGSTYPEVNPTHFVVGDVLVACGSGATPIV